MGKIKYRIDWTKPLKTRAGSDYRLYEFFQGRYANGAYYAEDIDVWFPIQHDMNGFYASKPSSLDIVNCK